MGPVALAVARKELREIVRDRRSLASGLLYGVWGPLVMGLALVALARGQADEERFTLAVEDAARAPSLVAYLESRLVHVVPFEGLAADAVRDRHVPVVVSVDEAFPAEFSSSRRARVTLAFDGSRRESANRAARVRNLLTAYSRSVGDTRLVLRGVSPGAIEALDIAERDYSTAAGRGASFLATLPMFVLLAAFIGGMSVAADVTAGERERGSLEPLLSHSAPRGAITAGKWAAVSAVALATVVVTVAVSRLVLTHPRLATLDVPIGVSWAEAVAMVAMLAPLAVCAAAVQMLISVGSRTYKEAQTQLSLLLFLPMIPGFLLAFGSIQPAPWMNLTPILGQHVFISGLVRGEAPTVAAAAALGLVTLVVAAAAAVATSRGLGVESTLRRHGT
jgi:sodium transport system permease protein